MTDQRGANVARRAEEYRLLAELRGNICRCGAAKTPDRTLCRACYWSLPESMRVALYRRIGKGYEAAYAAAAEYLDRHVRGPR
jgi:hypothetical protein